MSVLTHTLEELRDYELPILEEQSTASIQAISLVSGTEYQVTFSASITGVTPSNFLYIEFGPNSGFYEILSVGADSVNVDPGSSMVDDTGAAVFYKAKTGLINKKIASAIAMAERMTRQSFSGQKQYVDYYSGNGTNQLILRRRPVVSVDKIEYPDYTSQFDIPTNEIELKSETGIIHKKYALSFFERGKNNYRITYTVGYTNPPAEIEEAIISLAIADVLQDEASFSGNLTGRTIVAYSESYGAGGKYASSRVKHIKKAKGILNKYKSGMV